MPLDQSTITWAAPPIYRGGQVYLAWTSSAAPGTWFQVYFNGALAWTGRRTWTWVPIPPGPVRVEIGTVGEGERYTDFSADLPPTPGRRAQLGWDAPADQATLAGFWVYQGTAPGGPVDYAAPVATIAAFPGGIRTDGFGLGGFGSGGFGSSPGHYSWTSAPLDAGIWSFAVVSFDDAGNAGAAQTTSVLISAPPLEPAPYPKSTTRLKYTLSGAGAGFSPPPVLTLTWEPSPTFV